MKSRFIASIRRASNREEFDLQLKEIETRYPKATHYCWAYRFNGVHIQEHCSDAGEPSGTAGRPILGVLKKHDLENVMAVVTRYYGGVKLGVRGLISAYGNSVQGSVDISEIILSEETSLVMFEMGYDFYNILLSRLGKLSITEESLKVAFAEVISGEITVPNSKLESIISELDSISANQTLFSFIVN